MAGATYTDIGDTVSRPLGKSERFLRCLHKYGNGQIVIALKLNAKKQLDDSIVCDALIHLRRRFPMLRMRIGESHNVVCFQEMDEEEIDFESTEEDYWMTEYEDMLCSHYDEQEGPLWQAKLIKFCKNKADDTDNNGCHENKGKHLLPQMFKYVILFGIHHVITDGTSNLKMCSKFLDILNSLIAGEKIIDYNETEVLPALEELLPQEERKFNLSDILPAVKSFGRSVFRPHKSPYMLQYPAPKGKEGRTKIILNEFTICETRELVQRCKQEGATLHGAFTAAGNKALYEIIHRKKGKQDTVAIKSSHAVNMRRFCNRDMMNTYGFYVSTFDVAIQASPFEMEEFWKIAKDTTVKIHDIISPKNMYREMRIFNNLVDPEKIVKELFKATSVLDDFGTSNLGDTSKIFPGTGDHVEVEQMFESTSAHLLGSAFIHNFATFRGKLMYNMDYATNYVTEEQAREYAELTMKILRDSITGNSRSSTTQDSDCVFEPRRTLSEITANDVATGGNVVEATNESNNVTKLIVDHDHST